jgi:hypothetical protein
MRLHKVSHCSKHVLTIFPYLRLCSGISGNIAVSLRSISCFTPHIYYVQSSHSHSNRRQPAIPHNLCALISISILALPILSIILPLRHPKKRCPILPHHATLLPTRQRSHASPHSNPTPQTPSSNLRWISFRPIPTLKIPAPITSLGYRRQS